MGDAAAEAALLHEILIDVIGEQVAGDAGEAVEIGDSHGGIVS